MKERVAEEKLVKSMKSVMSYKTRVAVRWIFVVLSLTFLLSGCHEFSLVKKLIEAGGLSFRDLFSDLDFLKAYSAVYLEAIRQLHKGFFDFVVFLGCCVFWLSCELYFNQAKLLLRMIEGKEASPHGQSDVSGLED